MLRRGYEFLVLARPAVGLALLAAILAVFAWHARDFRLDASADSLLLEDDPDLQLLRKLTARYGGQDLLIVTFTPDEPLFSDASLARLAELREALRRIDGVDTVTTLLDVPLVESSDVPLAQMAENVQTLETPGIDRERARRELVESPIYRELVVSPDGRTAGVLVDLVQDEELTRLGRARNELLIRRREAGLDAAAERELERIRAEYEVAKARVDGRIHRDLAEIRAAIAPFRNGARVHLGGLAMIADDMIAFVRGDLIAFGSGVAVFVVAILTFIFRRLRWVALPLLSCGYATLAMIGLLGWIGWEVTVISSNFLALMLIVTISMNIHLVVRYRQLARDRPDAPQRELVAATLRRMVWPCLYTALTTIIGFGSLVVSDIKPVRDFGWMMSAGLAVVFATSFSLFPALLVLLPRPTAADPEPREPRLAGVLAGWTERYGNAILAVSVALAVASAVGISRLEVENSFVSYFSEDTEIYQGLELIDRELGGTTPLEVLLDFAPGNGDPLTDVAAPLDEAEDDDFEDWAELDVASGPEYWFTPGKVERIKRVHDYLDAQPEVGKVLSLASAIRVAEAVNDGEELDSFDLAIVYRNLPEQVRETLVDPYFDPRSDEARLQLRIVDSRPDLRRAELLDRIRRDLARDLGLEPHEFQLAGTLVLYNNMLQSLYTSQVKSFGVVLLGVAVMFLVLFRSLRLAAIGIVPNVLAAAVVLGLMGLAGIHLDVMTITIAAIAIGIAVDNAIHYIYRFREELERNGDYAETLRRCHGSIGHAVLYTSATLIFGFSILTLSNFLPTIYFGALTGLAIAIAMLAALTLLPRLILLVRPFPEG